MSRPTAILLLLLASILATASCSTEPSRNYGPGGAAAAATSASSGGDVGGSGSGGGATSASGGGGAPIAPADQPDGAATDRMLFWVGAWEVAGFSDADLDAWKSRGIGGFVMMTQYLKGSGGSDDFTADASASFDEADGRTEPGWALQSALVSLDLVARCHARGLKLYLGHYTESYYNNRTPFVEWFDDAGWADYLDTAGGAAQLWGAAHWMGFDGLAWDQEPYATFDGVASWTWNYEGATGAANAEDETSTRAIVRSRGEALMTKVVEMFPGAEFVVYHQTFPDGWNEDFVQTMINGASGDSWASDVGVDLWNGMTSVAGYGKLTFIDAVFYKTVHISGATWDAALQYNATRGYAFLSRALARWDLAADKVQIDPFIWIDNGSTGFEAAMSVGTATTAIAASRKWGLGQFANYEHHFTKTPPFDYAPYYEAMEQVAVDAGGVVDQTPPSIGEQLGQRRSGDQVTLSGTAAHPMGIRSVRYEIQGGPSGAFGMTWVQDGGDYKSAFVTHVEWDGAITAPPGTWVTITAESIKGQTHSVVVEL